MAATTNLSLELITNLEEIGVDCLFEEQARRCLLTKGFTVAKRTWSDWKAKGAALLYSEETNDRELTEYEQLLIRFYLALNNIGVQIEQRCISNINSQLTNPKNAEFNWRVLKIRNRDGEYDEKSVVEQQVSGELNINAPSLLDMIKIIKSEEKLDPNS